MDWKIEVIVVPVSDVERAKAFYTDGLGFHLDVDHAMSESFRIVQMTPPGSGYSVTIGVGLADMAPGSLKGVQLVVDDIEAAHAELTGRGVDIGEIVHFEHGEQRPGKGDRWNSFFFFDDPDGNSWAVQESKTMKAAAAAG